MVARRSAAKTHVSLSITASLRAPVAALRAIAVDLASAATATLLTNSELRLLAFRNLTFRPGQRCANQPAVNRAIVFTLARRLGLRVERFQCLGHELRCLDVYLEH